MMMWKEDDIQKEITFVSLSNLKYTWELNAYLKYVN